LAHIQGLDGSAQEILREKQGASYFMVETQADFAQERGNHLTYYDSPFVI
jgi:hypothetical protein